MASLLNAFPSLISTSPIFSLGPVLPNPTNFTLPANCVYPTLACLLSITLTLRDGSSSASPGRPKSYEGYQVLRLNITTPSEFESIKNLYFNEQYDFWSPPSMFESTDIMVPPEIAGPLKTFLGIIGLKHEVIYKNLQEAIEFEKTNYIQTKQNGQMNWENYQTVETIHGWMDQMAEQYPALVTVTTYGMSTEGRPMKVMKISTANSSGPSNRSSIWLDGGIHAREWISPATVTYIANELILQATRRRIHRLVDTFDFYIVPIMNPDGYAYTLSDRMWRKTRSESKRNIFGTLFGWCKGADPNRNWDYEWGGKGTSNIQCSPIYRGSKAASEPEVSSTQEYIMSIKDNMKLFITFHSYSQLLLLPWAYDNKRSDDYEELMALGTKGLEALEAQYGTKYKAGQTAELLYAAAGGNFDWAKAVAGVKYAYAFELRDTGKRGFILPPDNIVPSGKETFAAVSAMSEELMRIYALGDPNKRFNEGADELFGISE